MGKRELGQLPRTAILCVDSYEDGVLAGRFYHPHNEQGCTFRSLSQFLVEMERTLDAVSFPQPFNAVRTFGSSEMSPGLPISTEQTMRGAKATFLIRVLFRQNASWQGSVRWIEGDREESFRSALELIFLIDSVAGGEEETLAG